MIVESKTLELDQQKLVEYFKTKGRFKKYALLNDVACFVYWFNGENILYTTNGQVVSGGKDALLLKCGAYINELLPEQDKMIELVVVHFYPEMLRKLFGTEIHETLIHISAAQSMPVKIAHDDLLAKYIESLLLYFKHPEIVNKDLLSLKLKELVLILSRTQNNQTLGEIFKYLFAPEEFSFQQVIEAHLFSGLSIKELAYLTHRSMASFKRDFQKIYKTSPSRYIKNKRLEKAAQLLSMTHKRILDIIPECGFKNSSHFTRLFHEKFSLSPSAFRMSQTANSLS